MSHMDIKGAQELAQLLNHRDAPETPRDRPLPGRDLAD